MHNRLRGSTVYEVGAMDRVADGGAPWRVFISPKLQKRGILVINPCDKPISEITLIEDEKNRQKRKEAKERGDYDFVAETMKPIRSIDLRFVDKADFLVCNYNMDHHPCGTIFELATAVRQKKPTLIHAANGIKNLPDWLFAEIPYQFFFEDWDSLLEYIRHIDEDENVDFMDRWRPIDFSKMIDINHFRSLF